MAFARVTSDTAHIWAIPAIVSTTFTNPVTFYVRERGGYETCIPNCTTKEQVDLGHFDGSTYRNLFGIEDLTGGVTAYVRIAAGSGTVYATDIVSPDNIYPVQPRFLAKVVTYWKYTTGDGAVYHFPLSRWLSDSPQSARNI